MLKRVFVVTMVVLAAYSPSMFPVGQYLATRTATDAPDAEETE